MFPVALPINFTPGLTGAAVGNIPFCFHLGTQADILYLLSLKNDRLICVGYAYFKQMSDWINLHNIVVPIKSIVSITGHFTAVNISYSVELKSGKIITVMEDQCGGKWCYLRVQEGVENANKAKCEFNRLMDERDE